MSEQTYPNAEALHQLIEKQHLGPQTGPQEYVTQPRPVDNRIYGLANGHRPIGKLAGALAKAQKAFKPVKKTVENTAYFNEKTGKKNFYADLAAIIEATQDALASNELVVIQLPIVDHARQMAGVRTLLVHSSGEQVETELLLPATERRKDWSQKNAAGIAPFVDVFNPQTIGIATTYARRYSYQGIVGVAAELDDDANSISIPEGSKEAAQAVAAEKIAKARKDAPAPEADLQQQLEQSVEATTLSRADGLIRSVQSKVTKGQKGREYLVIEMVLANDAEASFFCFADHKYPDGSSTFGLLKLVGSMIIETKRPVAAVFMVRTGNKGPVIERPVQIDRIHFDEAGIPDLDNNAF